ncbi:MAG: hypothetical protein DMF59_20150, partial [Acidobacteria bacterium]
MKRNANFGNSKMMRHLLAVVLSFTALSAAAQFRLPKRLPHIPVEKIPGADKLLGNEPTLTTNLKDARTEIAFLDEFQPIFPRPLPAPRTGGLIDLPAGAYAYVAQSYCLRPGAYGPGHVERGVAKNGSGYLYAPLRGPRAAIIGNVLKRSADHPEIGQKDIQVLLWAIIARTKIQEMPPERQRVAALLLTPEEIFQL